MDETTLTQEPYLCKCWSRRGEQKQIPYPAGSHWAAHLFGGYNVMDNTLVTTMAAKRNTEGFAAWLEELMCHAYPTQQVCVVLDNASFHNSIAAQAYAGLFADRLTLFFLPAYSPELNPIEAYWKHLKRQVHGNHLCANQHELTARLCQELARQNDLANPQRYQLCN